jgi:tripartite-type tricarboxylate transporter receptor subunit TctC
MKWGWNTFRTLSAVGLLLAVLQPFTASAETVEEFYRGKIVKLIVGSAAGGGGYDGFARAMAPYFTRHIPGNPKVIVQNMPGGGGLLSSNYLYNVASRDGLTIGLVERQAATDSIVNAKSGRAQFDARKFNWIGSPSQGTGLVMVRTSTPVKTVEDLRKYEITFGAINTTTTDSVYARLLNGVFDMKIKIIMGYKSANDVLLALERGEVEGKVTGATSGIIRNQVAPWIQEGKIKVVAQLGLTKDPDYPDAVLITDLATTEEQKQILGIAFASQLMAFPLLAPPEVPKERVQAIRDAFDDIMKDSDFIADMGKQDVIVRPANAAQIEAVLEKIHATPPVAMERYAAILSGRD